MLGWTIHMETLDGTRGPSFEVNEMLGGSTPPPLIESTGGYPETHQGTAVEVIKFVEGIADHAWRFVFVRDLSAGSDWTTQPGTERRAEVLAWLHGLPDDAQVQLRLWDQS